MPISPQEQQELDDLELEELEHQEAQSRRDLPEEPSLQGGSVRSVMDMLVPGFTKGFGHGAVERGSFGNVAMPDKSDSEAGRLAGKASAEAVKAVAGGGLASAVPSAAGRIAANTALSGAQGALEKPEGEDGIAPRLKQGGISAAAGGLLSSGAEGIAKLLGKGAQVSANIKDVKSGEMANRAASAIDDASNAITEKQIAPRDAQLRELLRGKEFEVNPDRVKPVFPNLGNRMAENLDQAASPQGLAIAGGQEAQAPARATLSGDRALRLKRAASSAADYNKGAGAFDPAARAANEDADALAGIMRRQIHADPQAADLDKGMEEAYNLRRALTSREEMSPIETLTAKPGTSRGSVVDLADTAGGTKLRDLGEQIDTAKGMLLDPKKLMHPLSAPGELLRVGGRGALEASSLADALRNKSPVDRNTLIQALTPPGGAK